MSENSEKPSVHGINAADFAQWKHHPVTRMLHRYLEDYRAALRRDHADRWESGEAAAKPEVESEARGRAIAARELRDLEFEDILAFYEGTSGDSERNEDDDAATAD